MITDISTTILQLIQKNPRISFRQLLISLRQEQEDYGAQQVWDALRSLQDRRFIEAVKISNTKSGWKVQLHVTMGD